MKRNRAETTEERPLVIGLTGGIGAGKSTFSRRLVARGIPVFDCDAEVAAAYGDPAVTACLEERFGPLGADPRRSLATRAAADPALLDGLYATFEGILRERWHTFLAARAGERSIVLDAPLLFERGWDRVCDATVCLMVPRVERLRRVMTRPGMTKEKFATIDAAQAPDEVRQARADHIIDGVGTETEVAARCDAVLEALLGAA